MTRGEDRGLAAVAVVLLLAGAIASVVQAIVVGRVTAGVLALDTVAVTLLPYGLLAMYLSARPRGDDSPDGGGGGGGQRNDGPPPAPGGGLAVDWQRFEADFRTYVREVDTPVAPLPR